MSRQGPRLSTIYVTAPSRKVSLALATRLVQSGLVACANLLPGAVSVYRFRGKVCRDREYLCFFKTKHSHVRECMAQIEAHHPYDLPAIFSWDVGASARTQNWIHDATSGVKKKKGG